VAVDCLIDIPSVQESKREKAAGAHTSAKRRGEETEMYWDKKAGAPASDHAAKTNPVRYKYYI
jgi:hypothetical protein